MFSRKNDFKLFEKKVWLASPTMHDGAEMEYVKEAYDTNWIGKRDVHSRLQEETDRSQACELEKTVMALTLFYITNKPEVALVAEKYGVDRIWVDLETLGKEERQKNVNSVKSHHTVNDIKIIKPLLNSSEMLVRVNSWNENSPEEIEAVIDAGADIIMLPFWKSAEEVNNFLSVVDHRTKTTLLLETKEAVECIDEVLEAGGFDEIHIGLNDLHLSYGMTFMFELLANGTVEMLCKKFKKKRIPYGFGGIAKLGDGLIPAEKIIMEHYRLGSSRAILSRSFCNTDVITELPKIEKIFQDNMKKIRDYEESVSRMSDYTKNQNEVVEVVQRIVKQKKESQ